MGPGISGMGVDAAESAWVLPLLRHLALPSLSTDYRQTTFPKTPTNMEGME
jgi:hypothetical protein